VFLNGKVFIDGGMACNYPLNYCIESGKPVEEILGFKNMYGFSGKKGDDVERKGIHEDSTLLDFLLIFLFKAIFSISDNYSQPEIPNEIVFDGVYLSLSTFHHFLSNIDARKECFKSGKERATLFIQELERRDSNVEEVV